MTEVPSPATLRTPGAYDESSAEVGQGSFQWDVEEALTRVSYGFFRHIKAQTLPDEPELLSWWHQILNSQIAIGALAAECEHAIASIAKDETRQRLIVALSRLGEMYRGEISHPDH